eukprot:2443196-Rhodomonas_salina.1
MLAWKKALLPVKEARQACIGPDSCEVYEGTAGIFRGENGIAHSRAVYYGNANGYGGRLQTSPLARSRPKSAYARASGNAGPRARELKRYDPWLGVEVSTISDM